MSAGAIRRSMQEQMRLTVLGEMRRAHTLAALARCEVEEMMGDLERWKEEGQIFAIEHEGTEYFPLFALDSAAGYVPYAAVSQVLSIFGSSLSSWGVASWFIGACSFLDDQRPKDLLASDPGWVVDAAQDAMDEMSHR